VEAITLRDAEKASRLCAEHVRNACKTALASLREAEEAPNHGRAVPVRR
jgi:DNA-binding GntR family transcriptional regulator